MARCGNCNKFVSYGDPDIEVNSERVEDGVALADVEVYLTCAECGQQIKQALLSFEEPVEHECEKISDPTDYDHTRTDWSATDRVDMRVKNGKAGHPRTWRTYYGATVTLTFNCGHCGEEVEVVGEVEEQASAFEDL